MPWKLREDNNPMGRSWGQPSSQKERQYTNSLVTIDTLLAFPFKLHHILGV